MKEGGAVIEQSGLDRDDVSWLTSPPRAVREAGIGCTVLDCRNDARVNLNSYQHVECSEITSKGNRSPEELWD